MSQTQGLIQRKGRWYFNRAFPKQLWTITGKSPFRVSLRTDSLEIAKRRRPEAEKHYYAAVDAAAAKLNLTKPRELSEIEVTGLVVGWFRDEEKWRSELMAERRRGNFDFDGYLAELDQDEADARQAVAENDTAFAEAHARRLLEEGGLTVSKRSPAYAALLRSILRGRRELTLLDRARLLGDYAAKPSDPMFAGALVPLSERPCRTLEELIQAHKADRVDKSAPSTQASYEPVWRLVRDVLGAQCRLDEIDREQGRKLFEAIQQLPRSLGKVSALKGLSVPDAIEKGRQLGLPTISPKTINGSYMGLLKAMFEWGVREQWLKRNPLTGLTVEEEVADADKRDPFTDEQLRTIFGAAPWRQRFDVSSGTSGAHWGGRLCLPIGNIPPAEAEERYYAMLDDVSMAA